MYMQTSKESTKILKSLKPDTKFSMHEMSCIEQPVIKSFRNEAKECFDELSHLSGSDDIDNGEDVDTDEYVDNDSELNCPNLILRTLRTLKVINQT